MSTNDNMTWWDRLSKTDPDQTSQFKRTGGFSGTAVKPIYQIQKMTEHFGPCGSAWKISQPKFTTVNGADGEVLVFCELSVSIKTNGDFSAPIPGIGGDYVVKKVNITEWNNQTRRKEKVGERLQHDDESWKKAYTDAVGNALKFLGMSADIHMGQFDDSKYVQELRREKREEERQSQQSAPPKGAETWTHPSATNGHPTDQDGDHFAHLGGGAGEPLPMSFKSAKEIAIAIDNAPELSDLALIDNAMHKVLGKLSEKAQGTLMAKMQERRQELMRERAAA